MEIIQLVFVTGELAMECKWDMMALLPKGSKEFRIIGLVEVLWKFSVIIFYWRLVKSIKFHYVIHGFIAHG